MGERGPAPKPEAIRDLENAGHRNLREPKFRKGAPAMPEGMGDFGEQAWKLIVSEASRVGLLTKMDGHAIFAYAVAYQNARTAQLSLLKHGLTYMDDGIPKRRPESYILNQSLLIMKRYLDAFGMSPASRAKIQVPSSDEEQEDMDFFLRGKPEDV